MVFIQRLGAARQPLADFSSGVPKLLLLQQQPAGRPTGKAPAGRLLTLFCALITRCCRPSVSCGAEPEPVSGYTPADYISFSNDENKQCHHNAEVWVDAPLDTCYSLWSDWTKLLDFLDLIGQVGAGFVRASGKGVGHVQWLLGWCWLCQRSAEVRVTKAAMQPKQQLLRRAALCACFQQPGTAIQPTTWLLSPIHQIITCHCPHIAAPLQIGLDNGNPHMAMFQCFYRYRECCLLLIRGSTFGRALQTSVVVQTVCFAQQ